MMAGRLQRQHTCGKLGAREARRQIRVDVVSFTRLRVVVGRGEAARVRRCVRAYLIEWMEGKGMYCNRVGYTRVREVEGGGKKRTDRPAKEWMDGAAKVGSDLRAK